MGTTNASTDDVHHNRDQQIFSLTQDGDQVVLRYRQPDAETIEFYSTFTPEALRGRGLAGVVVDAGLQYAHDHHLRIIPTCSYVAKVLARQS